ncbi:hypothetical protein FRC07_008989 [Ceratobasidium sp. 392]|nr:hypothetical protein FRC07_008989 [Ceratobasidium sp. 392]
MCSTMGEALGPGGLRHRVHAARRLFLDLQWHVKETDAPSPAQPWANVWRTREEEGKYDL